MALEIRRAVFLKTTSVNAMKCLVDGSREKQLYLVSDTTYKHRTCTVMLLRTCTFQR